MDDVVCFVDHFSRLEWLILNTVTCGRMAHEQSLSPGRKLGPVRVVTCFS